MSSVLEYLALNVPSQKQSKLENGTMSGEN